MKILKTMMAMAAIVLAIGSTAKAHLGWTLDRCEAEWGMWIHTDYDSQLEKPTYLFRIAPNWYARVGLLNGQVNAITYYTKDLSFLIENADQILPENCPGKWIVYDDGRGKETLKTWRVVDVDGNSVAYALLYNKPEKKGYYYLFVASGLWEAFVMKNGITTNPNPSNI